MGCRTCSGRPVRPHSASAMKACKVVHDDGRCLTDVYGICRAFDNTSLAAAAARAELGRTGWRIELVAL